MILAVALILPGFAGADPAFAARRHAKAASAQKAAAPVAPTPTPYIAIDVDSGRVIVQRDSTRPWYPASTTKLMTVYVALEAVRQGRLTLDTPLVVSARAAAMQPSKMGFAPGTQVTLGNALKMLMVKSANDLAVTIAEGVSGSVEAFADEMNQAARALGMRDSHFVNPNGLHDPDHYASARDMAILGRALLLQFPDQGDLFNIGAFRIGDMVVPTHNGLIGRYPGADGMKTGFTCPAGFNLVASATRSGRRVVVVVFGDLTARSRTAHAVDLLNLAFASSPSNETLTDLPDVGGQPPNMKSAACGGRSKKALLEAENEGFAAAIGSGGGEAASNGAAIAALPRPAYQPVDLYVGPAPGYQGPVAGPRPRDTPIGAIAYTAPAAAAAAAAISTHATPAPKPAVHKAAKAHAGAKAKSHAAKSHAAKSHAVKSHAAKSHAAKPKHGKTEAKAAGH
jgi:D-alanyl-D-alanine carboxypeptidase